MGLRLIAAYLFVLTFWISTPASAQTDAGVGSVEPTINLIIIGVPEWQLEEYRHSTLGNHIVDACHSIVQFFEARFTPRQLKTYPAQPCTREATTYASIRRLLYTDLPAFGSGTLTFVFMMSHGEIVRYDNGYFSSDLRFITSDTVASDRDGTSLSIGIELLNWFRKISAGSTVLAFIDTCNGTAAQTLQLQIEHALQGFAGLRFGVAVASIRDVNSYRASFTRAILDLWQTETCPSDERTWLYERIVQLTDGLPLGPFEGRPVFLVDYGGGWCLNQLRPNNKLLFLYQGRERNIHWEITPFEGEDARKRVIDTTDEPFSLVLLPPGKYRVTALSLDALNAGKPARMFSPVDLTDAPTHPVFYSRPTTTAETVLALQALHGSAEARGGTSSEMARWRTSIAIAEAASDPASITAKALDAPKRPIDADSQVLLASEYLQLGNLNVAANLLKASAAATENPADRRSTALAALSAAGAAGNTSLADNVRKEFRLPDDDVTRALDTARREKSSEALEALKAEAVIDLAIEHQRLLSATSEP